MKTEAELLVKQVLQLLYLVSFMALAIDFMDESGLIVVANN